MILPCFAMLCRILVNKKCAVGHTRRWCPALHPKKSSARKRYKKRRDFLGMSRIAKLKWSIPTPVIEIMSIISIMSMVMSLGAATNTGCQRPSPVSRDSSPGLRDWDSVEGHPNDSKGLFWSVAPGNLAYGKWPWSFMAIYIYIYTNILIICWFTWRVASIIFSDWISHDFPHLFFKNEEFAKWVANSTIFLIYFDLFWLGLLRSPGPRCLWWPVEALGIARASEAAGGLDARARVGELGLVSRNGDFSTWVTHVPENPFETWGESSTEFAGFSSAMFD